MSLLDIKNLCVNVEIGSISVPIIAEVSLSIASAEIVALVGESGCGKSVTALAIARLLQTPPMQYTGGTVLLNGNNVLRMTEDEIRQIRGKSVSYIFQEPGQSLNPAIRVGKQIKTILKVHRPEKATTEEVKRLLKLVGIPSPELRLRNYPGELSGGMQQRVMIAMALANEPQLLIADEPTTALDVTIQAQILELLVDLRKRLGMAILLITHNLGIVGNVADRVLVMYAGQIVEIAPVLDLLRRPLHPYTRALIASVPKITHDAERLNSIPGDVPRIEDIPPGCRFFPRCPTAHPECATTMPTLVELEPGRWVRCLYAKELNFTNPKTK